ncbi:MAG: hypothetical protein M1838_001307 [Thelocarpon superellum]|nr:MAG: hypothetical protein M1838_001307 [Thelocarpon superellum]
MAQVYHSQLDAFDLYHQEHEPGHRRSFIEGPALPALGHALAGSVGSAISNVVVFPLDLIITRLQVQRQLRKESSLPHDGEYLGIRDAFVKIYHDEGGVAAFYTGVAQDTGKSVLDAFLFFLAYNFLRQRQLQSKGHPQKHLPVLEELNVGFLAGAFAKLITTPIANIVTRKQTSAMIAARSSKGSKAAAPSARSIATAIYQEKGFQGFWSGYSASLVLTLNPSLTFLLYESLKRATIPRARRDSPGPTATFLLAAISKAIASSITYPFSLAKARAQISARTSDVDSGSPTEKNRSTDHPENERTAAAAAAEEGAKKPRRNVGAKARARRNVFATIAHMAQQDGLGALYEGLAGEVLKGFFSHGITMIVKESVHRLIIHAYYILLKALRRYPTPEQLAQKARERVQDAAESVSSAATSVSSVATETAANTVDATKR